MDAAPWERLGLSANPFRPDATAASAAAWHVEQAADRELWALQREVLHGRGPSTAAVLGRPGSGKTHRLLLASERATKAGAFHAVQSVVDCRPDALVARLASSMLAGCRLGGLDHALAAPKWYRGLLPLTRRSALQGNPAADGHDLARALNSNVPAFLLLDGLHALPIGRAGSAYLETLGAMRSHLDAGVLVVWTCETRLYEAMAARGDGLAEKGTVIELDRLDEGEARRLLEVRLAAHRLTEGVDGLYPFTRPAVRRMNSLARGNPARLLRMAELLVESPYRGAFEVDETRVEETILARSTNRDPLYGNQVVR